MNTGLSGTRLDGTNLFFHGFGSSVPAFAGMTQVGRHVCGRFFGSLRVWRSMLINMPRQTSTVIIAVPP
jgi:hypothetical protein